jgi:hypothetical protein
MANQMVHAFDWLTSVEKLWHCALVEHGNYDAALDSFLSLCVSDESQNASVKIACGDFVGGALWRAKPHVALSLARVFPEMPLVARSAGAEVFGPSMYPSRPHLQLSIERQLDDCVWKFIDLGCDILEPRNSPGSSMDGETALHASARRRPAILSALVDRVENATTPSRSTEEMKRILEVQNADGLDALSQALIESKGEFNDIIDKLRLRYGVDLDRMLTLKNNPQPMTLTCMMIIRIIQDDIVPMSQLQYLLENLRPEPRFQDGNGRTLLCALAAEPPSKSIPSWLWKSSVQSPMIFLLLCPA